MPHSKQMDFVHWLRAEVEAGMKILDPVVGVVSTSFSFLSWTLSFQ
jgi:hypothetical protein